METSTNRPVVLVSGVFDLLHPGHLAFLESAAKLGELHVAVAADTTVYNLRGRAPIIKAGERRHMLAALRCVAEAHPAPPGGVLDFVPVLEALRPAVFVVNDDGDTPEKRHAVETRGIRYLVQRRGEPGHATASRGTADLRKLETVPFRLDLAGGWLDQPFVSLHHPGPVINCSLEPRDEYELRSGMSSSTRRTAMSLWGPHLPADDREKVAKVIFACENPPGTVAVSGSQDAIGIVYPGINKLDYAGDYWPTKITPLLDEPVLSWLESRVYLLFAGPREPGFDVLGETYVDAARAAELARHAEGAWAAVQAMDAGAFGRAMTGAFEAQVAMFPRMLTPGIRERLSFAADNALGYKITGAGGGGYVVLFSEKPVPDAVRIKIRRAVG